MNSVVLIGRLTRDPETRYTPDQMAVCTFAIAIDRPTKDEKKTDYPRITVFGRQAENCERFLKKGRLVGIQGRIQTGSYKNKHDETVFTTDVIAERVEFLERAEVASEGTGEVASKATTPKVAPRATQKEEQETFIPQGFTEIEEDIPF